jgi:hypothetical protein
VGGFALPFFFLAKAFSFFLIHGDQHGEDLTLSAVFGMVVSTNQSWCPRTTKQQGEPDEPD